MSKLSIYPSADSDTRSSARVSRDSSLRERAARRTYRDHGRRRVLLAVHGPSFVSSACGELPKEEGSSGG